MTANAIRKEALSTLSDDLPALTRPCPHCTEYRRQLAQLPDPPKHVTVEAVVYSGEDNRHRGEGQCWPRNLTVRCDVCHDTGLIPTLWGWRLISLAAVFLKDAPALKDAVADEIPF